ncbi:hypothetical protein CP532_3972 [Ophiocordyceps camponoti-leonardi (nom. inval.)]|nr:hypothetical protein CP532_3972 [Ophiocordyceps camponoti-leonardi (nom. inval.)]
MAFLEDPRLRQRWNQIAHDAEAVTENAAAGIWSIQHHYINPCFGAVASSVEQCTAVCFGSADERRRRRRERLHGGGGGGGGAGGAGGQGAEYSFDFYDDWNDDDTGWGPSQDWDRLLAGTGSSAGQGRRKNGGDVTDQPRRKRAMSYGTRRRPDEGDPTTIIPSTQPIGFLSRLPWRLGGTLRYRPSAADLQDNPGKQAAAEAQPLLGGGGDDDESEDDEYYDDDYDGIVHDDGKRERQLRRRSGTDGSGDTSDSFRSRGDIFPSDGEGDEDAVPLDDDDVTFDVMVRPDDRSGSARASSKGKRPEGDDGSRTVSRTTLRSENEMDDDGLREEGKKQKESDGFQAARLPRFS